MVRTEARRGCRPVLRRANAEAASPGLWATGCRLGGAGAARVGALEVAPRENRGLWHETGQNGGLEGGAYGDNVLVVVRQRWLDLSFIYKMQAHCYFGAGFSRKTELTGSIQSEKSPFWPCVAGRWRSAADPSRKACTKIAAAPSKHIPAGCRSARSGNFPPSSSSLARVAPFLRGRGRLQGGNSIETCRARTRSGVDLRRGIGCKPMGKEGPGLV